MTEQHKKIGATVLVVAALGLLAIVAWRSFRTEETPADHRMLMDAETGELFKIKAVDLKPYPMPHPKSGENTLYRTEVCYWGEECRKAGGTHVIMNELLDKEGPTYCPVCGHIMRFHNPRPPDYTPGED